ncbi:MAG: HAD family hydrolase [Firmicutes bacterium]|nr:HAD family hydrolase [Bacillota bacterium]
MKNKLIIFDMDNTILQSRIDFPKMKREVWRMLDDIGLPQFKCKSTADSIMHYTQSPYYDVEIGEEMWRRVGEIEDEGLLAAVMEPGAVEALDYLRNYAELAVLTNNTDFNLDDNLGRLGILSYLSCVAGRDKVGRVLKPEPGGMEWVMAQYPQIQREKVATVGDAWNDAAAAEAAGIAFVAYNRSRQERWDELGVCPLLRLTQWNRAACDSLLGLLD